MKLWLLGTGTPTPSNERMCAGYLVQAGDEYIVFDHGFGSHQRLLQLGVSPTLVNYAFFSHHHYDHMGDYPRLVLTRWDQGAGKIPDIRVFGPPPLAKITSRLFDDDGAFGPDIIARTQNECSINVYQLRGGEGPRQRPAPVVHELGARDEVQINDFTVRVAPVHHFAPHLISYGYRIDHGGQSIVYSGDTGPCKDLVELARGCDVLIHMCHHYSGTAPTKIWDTFVSGHLEAAKAARDSGAKSLVLGHITEQIDKPGIRERIVAEIREVYTGTVYIGADCMEIPVAGTGLNKLD